MSKNVRYWLWLQDSLGIGADLKNIIDDFGDVKKLYTSSDVEIKMNSSLTPRKVHKLKNTDISNADKIIDICNQNNWQIIDYDDELYPDRLREIANPPAVLFVDGNLPDIDNIATIAIVGTRKASEYSIKVTNILSRGITECGALVVSGGALGVDSAAHKGALMAGGKTIAVLGCGFGTNYLASNKMLRDTIRANGALVTEFPPFTPAGKRTFPLRNRIISGLCVGVVIVEAGVKSGSLITAHYAQEQNRDIFAVPASVLSTAFSGTNKLIEDGAIVATNPQQIISQYSEKFDTINVSKARSVRDIMYDRSDYTKKPDESSDKYSFENLEQGREIRIKKSDEASKLSETSKLVYDCLEEDFLHIDEIVMRTGVDSIELSFILEELEFKELVKTEGGNKYRLL